MKRRSKRFWSVLATHWTWPQVWKKLPQVLDLHLFIIYLFLTLAGQRKYGGPPPNWEGNVPGNGCEVFCGKIPKDMFEDELIPLFENCGTIWDLRLMMDPMTGTNRGYAFVTFTNREAAVNAVRQVFKPTLTISIHPTVSPRPPRPQTAKTLSVHKALCVKLLHT